MANVTVAQLIEALSKIKNKELPVVVSVGQQNQVYPFQINLRVCSWGNVAVEKGDGVTIFSSLPSNEKEFGTLTMRKKK